jgi:methyl-accepting chemotaxis protein
MLKKMGVGQKIGLGFGVVLVLLGVVAVWSIYGIGRINSNADFAVGGNALKTETLQKEIDHLNWAAAVNDLLTNDEVTELTVQTDPKKCKFGQWYYSDARQHAEELFPEIKEYLVAIEEPHNKLHGTAIEIGDAYHQADLGLPQFLAEKEVDHLAWINEVMDLFVEHQSHLEVEMDHRQCGLGKFLYGEAGRKAAKSDYKLAQLIEEIKDPHERLHASARTINEAWDPHNQQAVNRAHEIFKNQTLPALEETQKYLHAMKDRGAEMVQGMKQASHIYVTETRPQLEKVQHYLTQINNVIEKDVAQANKSLIGQAQNTRLMVIIVSVIAGVLGLFLAFTIARGIITSLKRIIDNLKDGSEQVGSASMQVSSASQSLAEGASEQASSLEETSSALEEMSSMTKQNAENANQANSLASTTAQAAEKGNSSMGKMAEAIQEIKKSSDETAKIIKVIDEIAFQTNLLALNAAVEAARAGEAGKGFAVVAEEVRNLAMRSAEAAKNTSALIEDSQQNADNGVKVTEEFTVILNEISGSVKKVTDLISEVAAASNEQASGIAQVNDAVTQIDQVTQQNASNAEESASASEELSAQAAQMQEQVRELLMIVKGTSADADDKNRSAYQKRESKEHEHHLTGLKDRIKHMDHKHIDLKNNRHTRKDDGQHHKENPSPGLPNKNEEIIPLTEKDKELVDIQ